MGKKNDDGKKDKNKKKTSKDEDETSKIEEAVEILRPSTFCSGAINDDRRLMTLKSLKTLLLKSNDIIEEACDELVRIFYAAYGLSFACSKEARLPKKEQ